ncbi:MAG TPA: GAF domain-containing protein, partial [Anaerolineales bacterium]|nr:GAF domain-containing protein [Anaerolineales bacterium]
MNGAQDTIDTLQARLTQLEAGSQRSAKIQAALYAIADAASASTDLPAFYAALHATIGQLMYARNFFIATLDRESGMISWPYYVDEHDTPPAPMRHAGDERTVSAYVMRSGKTFHHRTDEAARLLQRGEVRVVGTDNTDGVFVPLKDGNAAIGALAVQSYTPGIEYTEEDVRLLTFVAQHIATALTRARALEDTRQRNAELAIINSVQAGLAQELSLQAIYDLVGDRLLEIFQVHTVNIVSYDSSVGDLTDRYAYEKGDRTLVGGSIRLFGFRKHVVETRQSMVINRDILDLARQYGNPTLLGAAPKSAVFVPMLAGDRVTGVVSLQDMDRENAFSPADVSLLETLTAAMSVALENARLYDETQRLLQQSQQRAAELQIINSVQQGLASKLDMQAIYDLVGERLLSIFGVTEVEICEYDPTTRMLRFPYWSSREGRIRQDPLPLGTGLNSYIVETRKPLLLGTAQEILNSGAIMPPGVAVRKSLAGVPILSGERVLGAVSLHDEGREHAFGEAELNLLSALANSLGATLENARLYDETQRLLQQSDQRAAELQIINSVQQGLASKLDMQAIYELVGEKIREIFGADTAYIAVLDEAAQVFDFPFYVDAGKPVETTPLPLGDGLTSKVLAAREPLLLNSAEDVKQHGADQVMRLVPSDPGGEDLNRSYLGVPVWQGARVSAVVSIQSHRPHAFGENETRFLSTLANSMGVALENARLFDQLQARNREISEALEQQTANSEILRVIAGSPTDIQPVLDAVAQNAARLCNSYDAGIARVEGDRIRVVAHWGPVPVPPDQIDPGLPLTAETVTGRAILEARSIHVEDVRSAEGEPYPLSRESSQVTGQRTLLTTPLLREGRAIGAIVLRRQQIDPFTEKQAALLRVFADQAAIAIENVRLFGETKRLLSEAEQRAAELAIINSVQAGLASKLEMQSIYDLVGDKLRETFSEAQVVDILTYDSATGMLHPRYVLEKGRRFEVQPWPAAGFRKHVIETGDPLLINRDAARLSVVHGNPVVVGEPAKSLLFVPMKTGTQVSGVISLQHVDREDAFDAADLRLLQTLAGSMSVALENARLFDETQRLLQETEQRAAELAIINSVQQGLASKLDLQSIYELVCEQIRETFGAETAYIAILDPERKEFRVPYYVDQG